MRKREVATQLYIEVNKQEISRNGTRYLNDDVIQSSRQLFCRCSGGGNWNILESCSLLKTCGEVVPAEAGGELTGVDIGRWGDPGGVIRRSGRRLYSIV